MFRLAASTIACPDWPLDVVMPHLSMWGYEGVELRTFGAGDSRIASEPALTSRDKTRALAADHGLEIASIATSGRYDRRVRPPVLGHLIGDPEASVRASKRDVTLAIEVGAPIVRVYAYDIPPRERRSTALRRIAHRLRLVCDHARNNGVRLALQNGGAFGTAQDLAELVDRVDSPLLGAAYDVATGVEADDDPADAIALLGKRLIQARLSDIKDGESVPPGRGDSHNRRFVKALVESDFNGWLVYEWPKLFLPAIDGPTDSLPRAAETVYRWLAEVAAPTGSEESARA